MGWDKFRRKFNIAKTLTIGGDTELTRSAANTLDLAVGDTLQLLKGTFNLSTDATIRRTGAGSVDFGAAGILDLSGTVRRLLVPGGTAAGGGTTLAVNGQVYAAGHDVATMPRLYIRQNGTTYWFAAAGSA